MITKDESRRLEKKITAMYIPRAGELIKSIPMRNERFFSSRGAWYFATREGAPVGPFDDKKEAVKGLEDFVEFMSLAEPKTLSRLYAALSA